MKSKSFLLGILATAAAFVAPLGAAPVTYSFSNNGTGPTVNTLSAWTTTVFGSFSLNPGTNTLLSMTSEFTVADQGWGFQDPNNGMHAVLLENGVGIASVILAPTSHVGNTHGAPYQWHTINFTADTSQLSLFSNALAGINWGAAPTVTLEVQANSFGYPGWELHVTNTNSFSATVDTVPDAGSTAAMLGLAFAGAMVVRRRFVR